jgi:hypothetical protein
VVDLQRALEQRTEALLVQGEALHRDTPVGDAVVGAPSSDDDRLLRGAGPHVGEASQLHGGVDGLGARGGEEHACARHRGQVGQHLAQGVRRSLVKRSKEWKLASARIWALTASTISDRPCPTLQYQRLAMASR